MTSRFNLSDWALEHRSLVWYFMIISAIAGILAYITLGREEDPSFTIKTMVVAAQWPGATVEDTARQVTDRIEKITPRGIVTSDGTEREIDVLIVATGFLATDLPIARHLHGRDGVTLADHFAEVSDRPEATALAVSALWRQFAHTTLVQRHPAVADLTDDEAIDLLTDLTDRGVNGR